MVSRSSGEAGLNRSLNKYFSRTIFYGVLFLFTNYEPLCNQYNKEWD